MTTTWERNWTTEGWERAQVGNMGLGIGPSAARPGLFSWCIHERQGSGIYGEEHSGYAPTLGAARATAEYFARRLAKLRTPSPPLSAEER